MPNPHNPSPDGSEPWDHMIGEDGKFRAGTMDFGDGTTVTLTDDGHVYISKGVYKFSPQQVIALGRFITEYGLSLL